MKNQYKRKKKPPKIENLEIIKTAGNTNFIYENGY
jgi:hypothetical protein